VAQFGQGGDQQPAVDAAVVDHEHPPGLVAGRLLRGRGQHHLSRGLPRQVRIVPQDGLLQLPQAGTRFEPQLVVQHPPPCAIGLQRVRLPSAAVEREHQLGPQPLPHRVPPHLQVELGYQRRVPAQREVCVDAVLDGAQPQLVQPGGLGPGERRVRHVGERRALPQLQRAAQHRCGRRHRPREPPRPAGQTPAVEPGRATSW
jgi:hypothetical protein